MKEYSDFFFFGIPIFPLSLSSFLHKTGHFRRLKCHEMPKVAEQSLHRAVTALAVPWAVVGLGVLFCLSRRFLPRLLKFVSTGCDVVLLTLILVVASRPRSPLVVGYFLLIALSALRFNLPLVRFATVGSMAGYLFVLGHAKWFAVDDLRVPRYHQIIFLSALALTGICCGPASESRFGPVDSAAYGRSLIQ